jgi:hypothetical protein
MEEEDYVIAEWAQEDVETLYSLLNNNNNNLKGHGNLWTVVRRIPKIAKRDYWLRHVRLSFLPSVRPSIYPSALNNSAPTGRIFVKFYI